jgi:hypothetical protein
MKVRISLKEPNHMTLQPRRPLLETLRDVLRKMEADPAPETANLADLKRILRERISKLEATLPSGTLHPVHYEPAAQAVPRQ